MNYVGKVDPGSKVRLKDYDPGYTAKHSDRASADKELQELSDELSELQELLAAAQHHGMLIVRQGMYISKDEQERRLLAREQDLDKAWKVSAADWIERKYWDDYLQAYEDALSKCSTDEAPWYSVPADHKWYRNLAVAHTIVHEMRKYRDEWKADLEERGQKQLELLKKLRSSQGSINEE